MKKPIINRNKNTFEIVIAGRSNVGKSSLIGQLTGKKTKIGKRPGVTLKPSHIQFSDLLITDLPGFGFMSGVKERKQDIVKDKIVHYIEDNASEIKLGILVIDGGSFHEIVQRWNLRDEIPIDLELFDFFNELELDTIVAINKMDKIKSNQQNECLNQIIRDLGLNPPWDQWKYIFAPVSAKKKDISSLKELIKERLHRAKRDDLFKYV